MNQPSKVNVVLEEQHVEAGFVVDAGDDAREAALTLVVRYDDRELHQTIASCNEVEHGPALGHVLAPDLDLARCSGELHRVIHEPDAIKVERERGNGLRSTLTRIPIPNYDRVIGLL